MKPFCGILAVVVQVILLSHAGESLGDPPQVQPLGSYLFAVKTDAADNIRLEGKPYDAQPGDLVLFDDHNKLVLALYRICGTSGPVHTAIVVRRPDGTLGLMEAGPNMISRVFILDLVPRLHNYYGTLFVRRLKRPLTPEQSQALTNFALAQEGKSYAWVRLLMQGTPLRPRGPVRTWCLGKTYLDRDRWTCCELVAAAATAAGVLNPHVHFANAMYPRDFAYDEDFDLSPAYHKMELWYPRPELRWIGNGVETGYPGPRKPLPVPQQH